MEPNTQKVVVMRQGDREFQTETASLEVVHDVSAGADSDHIVHISFSEGVVTNPTQVKIRSSNRQVEAVEVDPNRKRRRLLHEKQYEIQMVISGIVAAITIQSGSSDKDSYVILVVINCPHELCYGIMGDASDILHTSALSILQPDWFGWWGFVIVCIIATAYSSYKCSDELKTKFTWCCEKVVLVMNYVIDKVIKPIRKDQAPPASAPTRASV